ncbi:hypothetical protein HAX54_044418 [Datura stramonium]|uniref:Uncharacterized protein n=1 Tax=Datura stramonium TaxID=4076 RepID=A0ABS8WGZ3_DATST|nr:hypothetical protein [Datura stramonium]
MVVAILMFGFPLNMGVIIADGMNSRAVKLSTSLPFQCLITQLCREAHVLILAGIDVEIPATKKYDLEKSKDKIRYLLKLHKLVIEVFRSSGQSARVAYATTTPLEQLQGWSLLAIAITATSESYAILHTHINDMEAQANDRLKDLTVPDLAKFIAELKKAQDDIC